MYFNNLKRQYFLNKKKINQSILKVLNHGQYILGPEVLELENKLKKYVNTNYCLSVSSGTDALLMCLMSLGISKDDEVITSSFSFISVIEVITLLGAKPILVDVKKNNGLMDENLIEKRITKKTKAIIPISLFGQMPDFNTINKIAKNNGNIPVVEDGAQSFGSTYFNKKSCSLSTLGITSFFPSKVLGCYGDGGAIFTNNFKIYTKLKQIRIHGQIEPNIYKRVGIQGRMDTIQCSIVLSKLNFFNKELKLRRKIFNNYLLFFKKLDHKGIQPLIPDKLNNINYYLFCLIVEKRKDLIKLLKLKKIPFYIYYPKPLNLNYPYKNYKLLNDNTNAKYLSKRIISLPMSAYLSLKDQNYIFNIFKFFVNKFK